MSDVGLEQQMKEAVSLIGDAELSNKPTLAVTGCEK